jgi:hypothetical protein
VRGAAQSAVIPRAGLALVHEIANQSPFVKNVLPVSSPPITTVGPEQV